MLSPFSLCIRHRDRDRQEQRGFGFHPVLGISGSRSLEEFFHPFAVFPDRDDERHPYPGQEPEDFPGIELPVKAECFNREAEFGDPVEAPGDVPDLRGAPTHRIHSQRHLPVFRGHVQGDVGIKLVRRFLAFASHNVGFILAGGRSVVRIVSIVDRELIRASGFQDVVHEVGEDSSTLLLQIVHREFLQVVPERCLTGYLLQKPSERVHRLVHCGHPHQSLEQVGLGERTPDRDGQVPIQCCDRTSTTFFRFQVAILTAGCPLPLGERHEGMPATHIDLSLLCGFSGGEARSGYRKLAKYWV